MKKSIKRLLGVALALVMCLTMAPATTAKADEAVALSEYTENQLLAAFMGEWEGVNRGEYAILSRNHIKMWNDEYDKTFIDIDWTYEGLVEVETNKLTWADWEAWLNGETNTYKTKALKFTGSGYVVYLYVEYSEWVGERVLRVQYTNETAEIDDSMYLMVKNVSEDEQCYVDELLEASLTATETPEEEPKAEEPTEEEPIVAEFMLTESGLHVTELNLVVGESERLEITGIDDFNEDNYSYTWISTYPEVAKVSQDGKVVAVAAGSATVTVSVVDNRDGNVVEVTPVVVTVSAPVEEPTPVPTETPAEEPKEEEPKEEEPKEEEPKAEEPTETPTVETEDKEIVEKTKDGRSVYTGETVYIVKKGDCLWNIAKQLLGNGARYKELFTRNNGIIERAKLIFPGQEVIVPAK